MERVQLELLDLGQELLKLRSQVNCIEIIMTCMAIIIDGDDEHDHGDIDNDPEYTEGE